jgi:hypothetical protein
MAEKEQKEKGNKEIVIYGITRSAQMLVVYVVAFVGMCFIFTDAIVSRVYDVMMVSAFGAILGLTAFAVIYGTMRYFAEQIVAYVSANMWYIKEFDGEAEEEEEEEPEKPA